MFRIKWIKSIVRVLTVALLFVQMPSVVARDGSGRSADWVPVGQVDWVGSMTGADRYDLGDGYVHSYLDADEYRGRWIRVSAEADVNASDFNIWIYILDVKDKPLFRPLPTACKNVNNKKVCRNYTWVSGAGDRIKIVIYQGDEPGIVTISGVERSVDTGKLKSGVKRFSIISSEVRRLFYSREQIDWGGIINDIAPSLKAPADIDPVPVAVSQMIARLPDNRHSFIFLLDKGASRKRDELPSCTSVGNGQWRLDMPRTPAERRAERAYVSRARKCLSRPDASLWIVNMTENGGGDLFLQALALAPLFGDSPLLRFFNKNNDSFLVELKGGSVMLSGKVVLSSRAGRADYSGDVVFVLGPGCGSSCEAIAIAAKGRFKTIGQPTAGLATVNETISIGSGYALALTSGVMADMDGNVVDRVSPDIGIGDDEIESLLGNGLVNDGLKLTE